MATIKGLIEAYSMMPVSITTGNESRPSTDAKVLWIGSTTAPVNMISGDVWLRVQSTGPAAPEILTTALNTLTQDAPFSQTLSVNGTPPFTFSISSGSLPAGLSLNTTTGTISGTPSASGSYSFTVQANNSVGSDTQAYTGTVTSSPVAPTITTTTLNSLTQSVAFSQTLNATGTAPLTWTISAGTLPSGLTLNSATGAITGSPTGSGAYSFTAEATNTAGADTQAYSGTIASSGTAPTITTTILSTMQVGVFFTQTINKTGSTPMTWGVTAGTMPAGLGINSSTGVISGTPTASGAYSFTVQATNAFGSDTQAFTGTVDAGEDATLFSIFAGAPTGSLTSHNDADPGSYVSTLFYPFGSPALPVDTEIDGARLYVPAGSAHIGQTWSAAYQVRSSSFWPGGGALDQSVYESNGTKVNGSALVAGWNYVEFTTKADVPAVGGSWVIGVTIGDGTRYLHDTTLTTAAIQQADGENFYMSETSGGATNRSFYRNTTAGGGTRWYGIDTSVSIPA